MSSPEAPDESPGPLSFNPNIIWQGFFNIADLTPVGLYVRSTPRRWLDWLWFGTDWYPLKEAAG